MAEKDFREKRLEDFDDVFADIINVLLFHGKRRVNENDLESGMPRSGYKVEDLFEIAYLTDKQVEMFKSDFRFVAEYFVANRKKKEGLEPKYTISLEHLKHVEEFTELMNAITNSNRFSNLPGMMKKRGGAPMFTLLFDEAEAKGEAKGEANSIAELIVKKVKKGKAIEQIADEMETTPAEIKKYYDAACKYISEYSGKELISKIVDVVMKEQP